MKKFFLIASFGFFFIGLFSFASGAQAASFSFYRTITVTSTATVASGTNVNFPMLVSSTLTSWESSSTGGKIQNLCKDTNGDQEPCDLVFATSSANCTTGSYLNFETDSYASSTGALQDWVNVPSMSTATVIYACYDTSSVTTNQAHSSSTWNSNYVAVYHLQNGTTLGLHDSTPNNNTLTNNLATATSSGWIDGAAAETTNQYLNTPTLQAFPSYTFSGWFMLTATGGTHFLLTQESGAGSVISEEAGGSIIDQTGNSVAYTGGAGNWAYIATTMTGGTVKTYVNGSLVMTSTGAGSVSSSVSDIGYNVTSINGAADEVRISSSSLSSQWILTEYNNQKNPSTFYAVGSETGFSSPSPTSGYAWGNKMGWVNFGTSLGSLLIYSSTIQGYAWSQNFGWINFGPLPSSTGVTHDSFGNLSGYAWSQGTGYIGFQGVTIDTSGVFHGIASGTIAGSLVFDSSTGCTNCNVTSTYMPSAESLSVSSVSIDGNNPANITLTSNATTSVTVNAMITDGSCSAITGGTTTILLYRSGVTSSSCLTGSGHGVSTNVNCYVLTAFTASSTCSSEFINTTTTFPVQYFAQATDASSSFPNQNWIGTVIFRDSSGSTSTADSTYVTSTDVMATLLALNVTTSSINYGHVSPSSTTGSVNQTTTIANAGNASTTLNLSGTALANGSSLIATSSQHYATSTFTFGGNEQSLSAGGGSVSGFLLTAPTSSTNVQSTIFWGLTVPNGSATGTYNATDNFTAVFSS